MHSLFLRGHELGGGGSLCDMQQPQQHLFFIKFFPFYSKHSQMHYIMKYLDSHLYRLC